jgi:hypothetical protein
MVSLALNRYCPKTRRKPAKTQQAIRKPRSVRFSVAETPFLPIFDPKWEKTFVNLGEPIAIGLVGFAHGVAWPRLVKAIHMGIGLCGTLSITV